MGKKKPCLLVRVLICFNVAADGGARRIFVNFTENMTADNHFLIPVGMLVSQEIDKDLEDIQYSGVTLFMPENVAYGNLSNARTYHLQSLPVRDKYSLMKVHMY
ncbi:hypothetical protein P8452_04770 [Trifolium repens]|jgi:hypothetical protein|nr:hypothetical protein P8452_04770 [Trifolium repens]